MPIEHDDLCADDVVFRVADPATPEARRCLEAYARELDDRFSAGFDPSQSISATEDELREPAGLLVLAMRAGTAIGCGALKLRSGGPAEIKRMWVDESGRGTGLGRKILRSLERHADERGVTVIRLETNESLSEAIALYRSAGYREVEAFNDETYAHHWFEKRIG